MIKWGQIKAEYRGGGAWHVMREGFLYVTSRIVEILVFGPDDTSGGG